MVVALAFCGCTSDPLPVAQSPHPVDTRDRYPTDSYDAPQPLYLAIGQDDVQAVRRLLDAGANPRARWGDSGDHHPLQAATEPYSGYHPKTHSPEIVRLLLAHGADPNARWCPFESRGTRDGMTEPPCTSAKGVTPLIMAALFDQSDIVKSLLAAGADPRLRDWLGISAIGRARSPGVFNELSIALFPSEADRNRGLLRLVENEQPSWARPTPWNDTVLSRAFLGDTGMTPAPPPPPQGAAVNSQQDSYDRPVAARVKWLLDIGADPNERITLGGVDWTPLQLSLSAGHLRTAEVLLRGGADPNARWCFEVDHLPTTAKRQKDPACTTANGTTPLQWAETHGRIDLADLLMAHGAR